MNLAGLRSGRLVECRFREEEGRSGRCLESGSWSWTDEIGMSAA